MSTFASLTLKNKELERTLQQIEKVYGEGALISLDDSRSAAEDCISTGSLALDLALGGLGLPRGRIVEMYGPESSGKTTLALHVAGQAQRAGGVAAFVDVEHALDPSWARRCGVNTETLLVSQPDSGEQAMEITEMLVRSNAVDIVVVDSVAALIPRAEIEGEMGDTHVALQARLMSQALRKLTGAISKSRCMVVFINQIRMKIGVMYGNPETTPGGNALKFYSSVRLDIRRVAQIKEGDTVVGNHVRAKVVKNKVAAPFRTGEFDIMFDSGISREGDLVELATKQGIVSKSGAWLNYGAVRLGQGRENAKQFLKDNPEVFDEIYRKLTEPAEAEKPSGKSESAKSANGTAGPSNGAAQNAAQKNGKPKATPSGGLSATRKKATAASATAGRKKSR